MKRQAVVLGVLGPARLRGARRCIVLCEYRVDDGAEHHGDHECGEDVTQRKRILRRRDFLKGWDPGEDEKVHGTFEACLRQADG